MKNQTKDYNELIPPENPNYPWKTKQLLCYYCNQPIYETTPEAGYKQRLIYMQGQWLHKDNHSLTCKAEHIRPTNEIDDPRCHVCKTQTKKHRDICSFLSKPPFRATPFSEKEEELISLFGWRPNKS
jgi:hypothetical protein